MDDRFHRALLFAMAERMRTFEADGPRYHRAYGRALEVEMTLRPRREIDHMLQTFDPVFGTYGAASDMLLVGMRDLVVAFDGAYKWATFLVPRADAGGLLRDEVKGGDFWYFRAMAAEFCRAAKAPA